MFCTSCGTPVEPAFGSCPACGRPYDRRIALSPGGRSHSRLSRLVRSQPLRIALALLPVVILFLIGGGYRQHVVSIERQREAAYQRSLTAMEEGDYASAQAGFMALGDYRDAAGLLSLVLAESIPLRQQLEDAQSAFLARDFERSISILNEVISAAPSYRDAHELLETVKATYAGELLLTASLSRTSRDWVGVEQSLSGALALQPENAQLASELEDVLDHHAPMVFTRDGVVLIAGPSGDDERALTADVGARWASWSPDRSRIAFLVPTPQSSRFDATIMVMHADGSGMREVIDRVLPFAPPQWSPDGRRLAYPSVREFEEFSFTGRISLNLVNVETGAEQDLTGESLNHTSTPTWSPDGRYLAFVSLRMDRRRGGGVELLDGDAWRVDVASRELTNLTNGQLEDENWILWSPAGNQMLVLTNPGDWGSPQMMHLYLLDAERKQEPVRVTSQWQIAVPSWSPDGSRFAYVTGGSSIRVWTDGQEEWVDVRGQLASHLTWSPDGSRLFVPTSSPPNPSWLVEIDNGFGTLEPVRLRADGLAGGNGIVMWAPTTPLSRPDLEGL